MSCILRKLKHLVPIPETLKETFWENSTQIIGSLTDQAAKKQFELLLSTLIGAPAASAIKITFHSLPAIQKAASDPSQAIEDLATQVEIFFQQDTEKWVVAHGQYILTANCVETACHYLFSQFDAMMYTAVMPLTAAAPSSFTSFSPKKALKLAAALLAFSATKKAFHPKTEEIEMDLLSIEEDWEIVDEKEDSDGTT